MSRLPLAALLAVAFAGCDDSADPPPRPEQPGCRSTAECPEGLLCGEGACVGGPAPSWPVTLRLTPAADSPLAPVELAGVTFTDGPLTRLPNIAIADRFRVTGRALTGDGVDLAVQVTARPAVPEALSRPPLQFSSAPAQGAGQPRFTFEWAKQWPKLGGGQRAILYALKVVPVEGELYPPLNGPTLPGETDGRVQTIELAAAADMPVIEGEVLLSQAAPNPLRGMSVFAVDASGQQVSTRATADENGRFSLRFWPAEAPRPVTIRARPTEASGPLPDIDLPFEVPPTPVDPPPLVRLFAGLQSPSFELSGVVGPDAPVPNATLRFRGAVGNGVHRVDARTDAEGRFTVVLYPGEYLIDLQPPINTTPFRLARVRRAVAEGDALVFVPQTRPLVSGVVLDSAGEPIEGARVSSRLAQQSFADPTLAQPTDEPPPRGLETATADDGSFTLQLDPGAQVLTVVPPPDRGLPTFEQVVQVPPLEGGVTTTIQVPPAAALVVTITDREGAPVRDLTVEAWRTDEGERRVAQGTTDADGRSTLVLPNAE